MSDYLKNRMQQILDGRPLKVKDKKFIKTVSDKRKVKLAELNKDGDSKLDTWFEERRLEMSGTCKHCGGKSCKNDDEKFFFSIAHILPKAYFPSIATHEKNWIELCFWKNNCHGNMDAKVLDLIDMNCFDEIIEKFLLMYPSIAKEERRRIPAVLMNYVDANI